MEMADRMVADGYLSVSEQHSPWPSIKYSQIPPAQNYPRPT